MNGCVIMDFSNKEQIKILFSKVTLFISLYESFLQCYEESVLSFYANHVKFENGQAIYSFVDPSGNYDKIAQEKYEKSVHRTIRRNDGNWDRDLSLFNWLKNYSIITDEHFEQLKGIRLFRNKCVHELDIFLGTEFPDDFDDKLNQLIEIRKHATKWWYLEIEYPTNPEETHPFDIQTANLDEVEVLGNSDLFYDFVKEIVEK